MSAKKIHLFAIAALGAAAVCAQEASPAITSTNAAIRVVQPGVLQIGQVRLDQRARTVTFPAVLNLDRGSMEYFLVASYGKTHESILRTDASPYDIHLAMVLLGAPASGSPNFPGAPADGVPGPIIHPSSEKLPGPAVSIEARWTQNSAAVRRPAGELVWNTQSRAALTSWAWAYNGSLIINNKFLAQADGSIVSLVTDPVALVNNNAAGHDNDEIWEANTNCLPPAQTPVEITITLP